MVGLDVASHNGNGLAVAAAPSIASLKLAAERIADRFPDISLRDAESDMFRRVESGVSVSEAETAICDILEKTNDFAEGSYEDLSPIPIPDLPSVPKLDINSLPSALREYVADCSTRRASPVEYVAASILTALGSVIGTKVGVQPKKRDSEFFAFPNLYALVIGPSGSKKSDSIKDGIRFAVEIEKDAWDDFKQREPELIAAADCRKIEIDALAAQIKASYTVKASKDDAGGLVDREILKKQFTELKSVKPETPRRLIIQDATIEKTGILLNENPNGVLAYHDEISPLLDEFGHKEKQRDRGFYLRAANGTGTEKIDRVGREDLHVTNLCLSVIGGTQPARIGALADATVKKDGDDGLLPRFGLAVWPDIPEFVYVDTEPRGVNEARGIFRQLYEMEPATYGVKRLQDEHGGGYFMTFDADAQEFFTAWLIKHQTDTRTAFDTNGTDIPASHYSKYSSLMPKLALIFQLVDLVSGVDRSSDISLKNAEMAANWVEFLKPHAARLYARTTKPETRRAKAILSHLRSGDLPHIFTARDLYRKHWKDLSDAKEVLPALEILIDYQWLRALRAETGGKPVTKFIFNEIETP